MPIRSPNAAFGTIVSAVPTKSSRLLVLFGNQLFPDAVVEAAKPDAVFMAESPVMCAQYRAHRHKLILILSGMRSKADALTRSGIDLHYTRFEDATGRGFGQLLANHLERHHVTELVHFETESPSMEAKLHSTCETYGLRRDVIPSPKFMTTAEAFAQYRAEHKRLFMADFYRWQRKRLGILVDAEGQPAGGQWSFDEANRKKLPKGHVPPPLTMPVQNPHTPAVAALVDEHFPANPGDSRDFWLPTTNEGAEAALEAFLAERFSLFGDYEDALSVTYGTIYHSLLSPLLNLGLITPTYVIERALAYGQAHDIPLNSVEGFVRQVIGWREFIRGAWRTLPQSHWQQNFWQHEHRLADCWYDGTTEIPPLDDAIRRARDTGYNHHIERLMVVGNLMLLAGIQPAAAYRWFMEMYVDSADWVMAPNVYGMALFSEGGAFTTKPYICGSNYLRKMSDYPKGPWCEVVDGLYWSFVHRHREFFMKNPRSKMMLGTLDRIDPERRERIFSLAETWIGRVTR